MMAGKWILEQLAGDGQARAAAVFNGV